MVPTTSQFLQAEPCDFNISSVLAYPFGLRGKKLIFLWKQGIDSFFLLTSIYRTPHSPLPPLYTRPTWLKAKLQDSRSAPPMTQQHPSLMVMLDASFASVRGLCLSAARYALKSNKGRLSLHLLETSVCRPTRESKPRDPLPPVNLFPQVFL